MSEVLTLSLSMLGGLIIGAIFFGGLWWTVRHGVSTEQPALFFFGSLMARMSIALIGFYFAAGNQWERQLLCLLGFIMARLAVMWLTRQTSQNFSVTQEVVRAP
jgi:F1F0 ATPase subunit 2